MDACYPPCCAVCRRFCDVGGPLCAQCADLLHELSAEPACPLCGKPLAQTGSPCPWCRGKGLYPYKCIARLGKFEDPLRELVYHLKYHRRWPLGEVMADWLLQQQSVRDLLSRSQRLLAVPLHFRREFLRGYNQAEVVARRLASRCGIKLVRPMKRIRDTATQTQLRSQKVRHENVRGAFALANAKSLYGRHVVIVDDVMTSGATLQAVGREVLLAEPASISAIVLAVADPKGRDFRAI